MEEKPASLRRELEFRLGAVSKDLKAMTGVERFSIEKQTDLSATSLVESFYEKRGYTKVVVYGNARVFKSETGLVVYVKTIIESRDYIFEIVE